VTDGIVSLNGRTVSEGNGVVVPGTIRTSVPVNPGNGGGALVDLQGEVIGIPTLAARGAQGGAAAGVGFAIPSNIVKLIAGQLAATGAVTNTGRAALGVRGATALTGTGTASGVVIVELTPGGAVAAAACTPGDVNTAVNGHPVPTLAALLDTVAGMKVGDTVVVTVTCAGQSSSLPVTLQPQRTAP
jgi:S1-C subfamily serine protease